ncbi:acyltransferase [Haloarcula laminariae]|uniref:acyltransferase n=1 Tax=Haloarcula laminariae TaxID=2961577 RepID=UPI0021C9AA70|nr:MULTISPECIES: acyltransferase [Halomicroarcula]
MDEQSPGSEAVETVALPPYEWYRLVNPVRFAVTFLLFEALKYLPPRVKAPLYRVFGADIGDRTTVAPHVVVDPFFPGKVSIGEDCIIGWGTKLLTHEADVDEWRVGPVRIGDDVTVGHSCSLRPGVTIGDGATVAAHSFVNRDVEPGETVGGVPVETLSDG